MKVYWKCIWLKIDWLKMNSDNMEMDWERSRKGTEKDWKWTENGPKLKWKELDWKYA